MNSKCCMGKMNHDQQENRPILEICNYFNLKVFCPSLPVNMREISLNKWFHMKLVNKQADYFIFFYTNFTKNLEVNIRKIAPSVN